MEDDMISDVLKEIRRQAPELTHEAAAKIDLAIRKDWSGNVIDEDIEWVKDLPSKEIGSGITKHVVRYPETGDDVRKLKSIEGSMRDRLDRVQEDAWETLYDSSEFITIAHFVVESIRSGENTLPPSWLGDDPLPDFKSRRWAQDCRRTASLLCTLIERFGFKAYEDAEWFAAKTAQSAQALKAALYVEGGSYPSPTAKDEYLASCAMKFARLQAEWELKQKWESRAMAQSGGGEALARSKAERKDQVIKCACEIWGRSGEVMRLGEAAGMIKSALKLTIGVDTIRGYLKEAERNGSLTIPDEAKKHGRPKKEAL